ncbi:IS3 family transposase [Streptomyces sp. NPDC037389]|uniref:IS3 family transposase n=1 Tax=Streptomyces sp. NPDC037389 TaxID=3155369 RepID=UPI0033EC9765
MGGLARVPGDLPGPPRRGRGTRPPGARCDIARAAGRRAPVTWADAGARCEEGWLYLATVIDIASRRVVGWATAGHLRTELVSEALKAACRQRRPAQAVIFHSDRGCQYTIAEFAALSAEFGIRLSVGRTGQCWDNALAESFFATIKRELLGTRPWPSRALARTAVFDFIEGWYNSRRLHSSLGYRSPAEYETDLVP